MKRELLAFALDLLFSTQFLRIPRELLFTVNEIDDLLIGGRGLDEVELSVEISTFLPRERGYMVAKGYSAILVSGTTLEISPETLLKTYAAIKKSGYVGHVHVHPVFLPVPSPSDAFAAGALGSRMEAVAAAAPGYDGVWRGVVTFYRPRRPRTWRDLGEALIGFRNVIREVVSRYLLVDDGGRVVVLPCPSFSEGIRLVRIFAEEFSGIAEISYEIVMLERRTLRRRGGSPRTSRAPRSQTGPAAAAAG